MGEFRDADERVFELNLRFQKRLLEVLLLIIIVVLEINLSTAVRNHRRGFWHGVHVESFVAQLFRQHRKTGCLACTWTTRDANLVDFCVLLGNFNEIEFGIEVLIHAMLRDFRLLLWLAVTLVSLAAVSLFLLSDASLLLLPMRVGFPLHQRRLLFQNLFAKIRYLLFVPIDKRSAFRHSQRTRGDTRHDRQSFENGSDPFFAASDSHVTHLFLSSFEMLLRLRLLRKITDPLLLA